MTVGSGETVDIQAVENQLQQAEVQTSSQFVELCHIQTSIRKVVQEKALVEESPHIFWRKKRKRRRSLGWHLKLSRSKGTKIDEFTTYTYTLILNVTHTVYIHVCRIETCS